MTNCTEINELLSMYIDGQLGENEKKQFEEHIAGCEACKREYEEILSIVRLCEGIEEEELPPDFGQKLHARLIEANGNNLEEASAIESISEVPDESISESISGSKSESSSESSSESKAGKIIMMFRNTYFRVGASVAAALLLVFLVRGIYSPGVLTNTTGSLSISANESAMDKASEARQESAAAMTAPAAGNSGGEAASAADMPADGNTNSTTVYGSSGDNQSEEGMGGGSAPQAKMAEVPSVSAYVMNDQASGVSGEDASSNDAAAGTKAAVQPVETDRAAADARLQQPMLAAMLAPETATSTEASVDIVTADKKAAIEQIKAIAIKYEGAETTAPVSIQTPVSTQTPAPSQTPVPAPSPASSVSPTVTTVSAASAESASILYIKIPTVRYDTFIKALTDYAGSSKIKAAGPVVTDLTAELEALIAANNELDSRILALEAGDTVKNSTELEALKAEMTANESRIEGIRLDREFTIVKISLF